MAAEEEEEKEEEEEPRRLVAERRRQDPAIHIGMRARHRPRSDESANGPFYPPLFKNKTTTTKI